MIDGKEYAKQMRENAVIDDDIVKVSKELWHQIADVIEEQQAEIDRLTTLAELGNMRANDYRAMRNKAKTARAEAIKEFADKLITNIKEHYERTAHGYSIAGWNYSVSDIEAFVHNLVKEMVGADNG